MHFKKEFYDHLMYYFSIHETFEMGPSQLLSIDKVEYQTLWLPYYCVGKMLRYHNGFYQTIDLNQRICIMIFKSSIKDAIEWNQNIRIWTNETRIQTIESRKIYKWYHLIDDVFSTSIKIVHFYTITRIEITLLTVYKASLPYQALNL